MYKDGDVTTERFCSRRKIKGHVTVTLRMQETRVRKRDAGDRATASRLGITRAEFHHDDIYDEARYPHDRDSRKLARYATSLHRHTWSGHIRQHPVSRCDVRHRPSLVFSTLPRLIAETHAASRSSLFSNYGLRLGLLPISDRPVPATHPARGSASPRRIRVPGLSLRRAEAFVARRGNEVVLGVGLLGARGGDEGWQGGRSVKRGATRLNGYHANLP